MTDTELETMQQRTRKAAELKQKINNLLSIRRQILESHGIAVQYWNRVNDGMNGRLNLVPYIEQIKDGNRIDLFPSQLISEMLVENQLKLVAHIDEKLLRPLKEEFAGL